LIPRRRWRWSLREIRKLLRALGVGSRRLAFFADALKVPVAEAGQHVRRLERLECLEADSTLSGERWWKATPQGRRLASAAAAPPVHRRTAERALQAFLARAQEVNQNPYFLYRVRIVVVFGSFLTGQPYISDLDLAIKLEPKEPDPSRREAAELTRIEEEVEQRGRRFATIPAMYAWPQIEVMRFLRGRSRVIQIHDMSGESGPLPEGKLRFRG
jgi:predicted nucleotidyltransferase